MFVLLLVVAVSHWASSARFMINPVCEPPRGTVCVEIRKCRYFADLLDRTSVPRPTWAIRTIKNHQCGFANNAPKVCCFPEEPEGKAVDQELPNPGRDNDHPNAALLPESCGAILDDARITHGTSTALSEFPWMALLAYYSKGAVDFHCAGTLINERYVLTAAHCVVNHTVVGVRLGEHDIGTEMDCDKTTGVCAPPVQDFYIEDIIPHPEYNRKSFINDIALIRLATSANLTYENARPICLPLGQLAKAPLEGQYAVVAGWGVTEKGYKSPRLLKVSVPVMSTARCRRLYRARSPVTADQVCAGGAGGRDSCGGDSGGPLMTVASSSGERGAAGRGPRYVQQGIVSYGPRHCGAEGQPGIYTRVAPYVGWILDKMKGWED